jgi:hypothetical protein
MQPGGNAASIVEVATPASLGLGDDVVDFAGVPEQATSRRMARCLMRHATAVVVDRVLHAFAAGR